MFQKGVIVLCTKVWMSGEMQAFVFKMFGDIYYQGNFSKSVALFGWSKSCIIIKLLDIYKTTD